MKTLKSSFIYSTLLCAFVMTACQQEELDSFNFHPYQPAVGNKAPNPGGTRIPTPQIIRQEFPNATGWRIIWDDADMTNENWKNYAGIFSTLSGSVHSIHYLNDTDAQNTVDMDMFLLFGQIAAPSRSPSLDHQHLAKTTLFKRSAMTVEDLIDISENNPSLFKVAFETEPYLVDEVQPVTPEESDSYYYKAGDIYTFKTDREPSKYGVIRIVELDDPTIIEVVVQKGGVGGFIPKSE